MLTFMAEDGADLEVVSTSTDSTLDVGDVTVSWIWTGDHRRTRRSEGMAAERASACGCG